MLRKCATASLILLTTICSCIGGQAAKDKKPAPEKISKEYPVSIGSEYRKTDFAKSVRFDEDIKAVKRVAIKYGIPKGSKISESDLRATEWNKEIEKALIRMGFIMFDEKEKDILMMDDDAPRDELKPDASIYIDRVETRSISVKQKIDPGDGIFNNPVEHPYSFFLGDLSGRLVLRNNDVLWSCSVVSTSFDVFVEYNRFNPTIAVLLLREHRFSEKLNRWVPDKWAVEINDNFSARLKETGEEFHKRELIRYTVGTFFSGIRK